MQCPPLETETTGQILRMTQTFVSLSLIMPAASVFEEHLRNEPNTTSRRCVKRLRGIVRPQYPLRVGEVPRFYDVSGSTVEILAIVSKSETDLWLARYASPEFRCVNSRTTSRVSAGGREARDCHHPPRKAGRVLIGFQSEDDWFDYCLEDDPRFLQRTERARRSLQAGRQNRGREGGDIADGVVRHQADRAKSDRLVTFDQDFARRLGPDKVALLGTR